MTLETSDAVREFVSCNLNGRCLCIIWFN